MSGPSSWQDSRVGGMQRTSTSRPSRQSSHLASSGSSMNQEGFRGIPPTSLRPAPEAEGHRKSWAAAGPVIIWSARLAGKSFIWPESLINRLISRRRTARRRIATDRLRRLAASTSYLQSGRTQLTEFNITGRSFEFLLHSRAHQVSTSRPRSMREAMREARQRRADPLETPP